jgi:hypothetical protein
MLQHYFENRLAEKFILMFWDIIFQPAILSIDRFCYDLAAPIALVFAY